MNYPWQYDETIQVGTNYRNQDEVSAYDDRMQMLRNIDTEVRDIRAALGLTMESTVWEIGTGTGECALALAHSVTHVYATDISVTMLEYAQRKASQHGVGNITFAAGGFLSGFRPKHPVNGVVTQLALHHLPDFWKSQALVGIANSLHPRGRLYLRDVVFPSATDNYGAFFEKVIDDVRSHAGDEVAQQTVQHIKTEFSTLDWILEGLIARSGLKIVDKDCHGFLSVYVCEK